MKKLIAIGGGEIGRDGYQIETRKIDEEIIKLSGKKNPKILFIPTASKDSQGYISDFKKYFGGKLGCITDILELSKNPSKEFIRKKILSSDIIYVGGGNTLRMMSIWRANGIDKILKEAYEKEIIISGLSSGAICWFNYGHSDSKRFVSKNVIWNFIKVRGLGWYPFIFCPHYHFEKREKDFQKMIKRDGGIGLAFDNKTAIEIIDNKYRILKSEDNAKAYRLFKKNGIIITEELTTKEFKPLSELSET